jgi:anti-sigma B factor antagonist
MNGAVEAKSHFVFPSASLYRFAVKLRNRMIGDSSQGIFVGCLSNRVHARVVGRATFQNSQPLHQFALEKIDQGQFEFVVDLGPCQGMDSTFLGVLAGIALRLQQSGPMAAIHIVNISPRHMEILQTLGLDRLFLVDGDAPASLADTDYRLLPDTDITQLEQPPDKVKTADLMIEAHDNLVRVDPRNTPRFKELARILREANRSPIIPPVRSR